MDIDTFHRLNSYTCFALGASLNLLLWWLAHKKTTSELKPYSRLILQTAYVDLAVLSGFVLVGAVRLL